MMLLWSWKAVATTFVSVLLVAAGHSHEPSNDSLTTMDDNLASTATPPPSLADIEAYWRLRVNYTYGEECTPMFQGTNGRMMFCVCYFYCYFRAAEPWEIEIRDAIFRKLKEIEDAAYKLANWHYIIPFSVMTVAGVFGNSLVLVLVHKFMPKRSVVNIMITSLAVADLLVSVFNCPVEIYLAYHRRWDLKVVTCYVFKYVYYLNMSASIFTLTAMSAERYLVICQPMKAQGLVTYGRAQMIAVGLWIASAVVCVPTAFMTKTDIKESCSIEWSMTSGYISLYAAIVFFFLPSLVMGVLYTLIGMALYRSMVMQKKIVSKGTNNKDQKKDGKGESQSERIQVIKMLIAVVVMFVVCWGPSLVFRAAYRMSYVEGELYDAFPLDNTEATGLIRYLLVLSYSNSAINPILYFIASRQFRKALYQFLAWSCCCCPRRWQDKTKLATTSMQSTKLSSLPSVSA